MEDVNERLRLADALFTEMSTNSGDWDELRRRILPRMESKARQSDTVDGMTATAEFSPVAYKSLLENEMRRFQFQQGDSEGFVNYALTVKKMKMTCPSMT